MSFQEKSTWVFVATAVAGVAVYIALLWLRARHAPLPEVSYAGPMLACLGGAVIASIVGQVAVAATSPRGEQRLDPRDREIARYAVAVGQIALVAASIVGLLLALIEAAHFWIAHAIYLGFVASTLLAATVKLAAYRRGFAPR